MKNVKLNIRKLSRQGFSLVEMLVVIAVIGIIAAIAIPNIGNVNAAARTATAQRNAQTLASTYSAALAAGVSTDDLGTTIADIYTNLGKGVKPAAGPFADRIFIVPGLPSGSVEKGEVTDHLGLNADNSLAYKSGL